MLCTIVFASNGDSYTPEGDKMTSALFSEPGLGTTCMADFQDGYVSVKICLRLVTFKEPLKHKK